MASLKSDPSPVVGVLVFNQKKELLLLKSHKWHNLYMIPGGHIELGEKIIQACIREVKEETGLNIYNLRFVNLQEAIFDSRFYKKRHFVFIDYLAFTKSTKIVLNNEAQAFIWVSLKKALTLPLNSYTEKAVNDIIKRKLLK
jgi:nucleoside triphosphatase